MNTPQDLAFTNPPRPKPKATWRDDARQRQTQAALENTILTFAAERPSTALLVTEITNHACINRSTFYNHTSSPTTFLRAVMRNRLEQTTPTGVTRATLLPELITQLIEHVRQHDSIYRAARQDAAANASLRDGLTEYTQARLTTAPLRLPNQVASIIAAATAQATYPTTYTGEDDTADEALAHINEGTRALSDLLAR